MLPKTAEYALRAVTCLARAGERPQSADQLAEATGVPRRYLHKVLQDLAAAELVWSRSGPGGGYMLACLPTTISILDVVNAVAPLQRIRECPLGISGHKNLCPLHQQLDRVYADAERSFAAVTLGQLIDSGEELAALCQDENGSAHATQ